jgi:hypothetical protein
MAGTATEWRTTALAQNAGQFWGSLAIPGAGARLTLHTDGTPESVANPTAFHYGATKAGSKLMIKSTQTKFYVDEFRAPIITNIDTIEMGISAELVAVTDHEVITKLLPGVGTYATTAATFEEVRVGIKAIAYECVALIFPLIENTTKFGVFNIYSSLNDTGVEWTQSRKELGFMPVSFVGYEITTRAATDTLGNYWKQIA